ncbi:uncharacterized protein K452DRAFT_304941 [Aplosporella prunicola CBS 121167]|uniref:Uncharacterized protein n=1 Tax=Aplosporella prunicola CBS 121167 TaxID=1176127 RepID=A0A6A6BRT7_9PEZI|nr:uncharacterized protein K452DRAFT_304941 [Aplosporella prunicola CBS 121167]KAF2145934.1 hypothetical protein K452DRAFT_304941 [Aplosporella prunicola CBS 121167]
MRAIKRDSSRDNRCSNINEIRVLVDDNRQGGDSQYEPSKHASGQASNLNTACRRPLRYPSPSPQPASRLVGYNSNNNNNRRTDNRNNRYASEAYRLEQAEQDKLMAVYTPRERKTETTNQASYSEYKNAPENL